MPTDINQQCSGNVTEITGATEIAILMKWLAISIGTPQHSYQMGCHAAEFEMGKLIEITLLHVGGFKIF